MRAGNNGRDWLSSRLGRRLLVSYLIVAGFGMGALALAAWLSAPAAFERHLRVMGEMAGGQEMIRDLYRNFGQAVTEALLWGLLASALAAGAASLLIGRQILGPVRRMMQATRHIADGHFDERLPEEGTGDELDDLGHSFNRMANALDQAESLRRDLIGTVAHELRTPLTTIQGHLEGLLDGVLPAELATFELIQREAVRLETLVNDLQELSRVESGSLLLERQWVEPAELAAACVARLALQFQEKGVELRNEVRAGLPRVRVDPDRIGQVLLNLAGNALQYTPAGGVVTLSAEVLGGTLAMAVSDNGTGIPAEHLPHIFTRFYRVDRSRSRAGGGSGIGLTIALRLAEAHGGTIVAESAGLGQGSRFSLRLPHA